jgi:hypothetical protein
VARGGGAVVGSARVVLGVDNRGLKRGLADAEDDVKRSGGRMGSVFSSLGKAAGGVAVAGIATAGYALKKFAEEAMEAEKVTAQTEAVLKSTGGAANVTAGEIDRLAGALMAKTGVDDETIKSGQNVLLTFTKVRNEVGAGNDVFNQATKTALDMSTALGTDMSQASMQLGKALNDPIAGVGALRRVGVSFTEAQKDQIKTLVESGRTMDAQKLILKELSTEFGGSAEAAGKTFGGQLNILKQTLMDTGGEMVAGMLPTLTRLATNIATEVVPRLLELIRALVDRLRPAFAAIVDFVREHWPTISAVAGTVVTFYRETVFPIFRRLGEIVGETVAAIVKVFKDNQEQLTEIWTGLSKVLRAVATVLQEVVLPVVEFVLTEVLPRAIGVAITAVSGVTKGITVVLEGVADAARAIRRAFEWLADNTAAAWKTISDAFTKGMAPIKAAIDPVASALDRVVDAIKWLIEHIPKIPKLPNINPFGGGDGAIGIAPPSGLASARADVNPGLWDEIALGEAFGLSVYSTYRPGAITSTGRPSNHGVYPSKAVDMGSGSNVGQGDPLMRSFFNAVIGRAGISELILSPLWWHPGSGIGRIPANVGSVLADHWNHVHVGIFGRGAVVDRPTLAVIGDDGPEAVIPLKRAGLASELAAQRLGAGLARSPFAGAVVSIVNNYLRPPEEPHQWSRALEFELRAMVG